MAPPPAAKPSGGLQARLTRKVGPLPVIVWAALLLAGGYLLYRRSGNTGSTPAAPTNSTAGSDSGAQVPASGAGGTVDNLNGDLLDALGAQTQSLDALALQIYESGPYGTAPQPTDGTVGGTNAPPGTNGTAAAPTTAPVAAAAAAGHQTQTQAGSLRWGGLTFTTRSAFDQWARSHGTTATAELRQHPQAKAIYGSLG